MNDDDNNSIMLKKVDQFLVSKSIFCNADWLKSKIQVLRLSSKIEEEVYKEVLATDLNTYVDQNRALNHCSLTFFNSFDNEKSNFDKAIFTQLVGYHNIAEPSFKNSEAGLDQVDENEFESRYLQGEDERKPKAEKVVLKLQLTNGVETIYGFEYEVLKNLNVTINKPFPKLIIGPNVEVRRGIFFLKNNNVKLL